MREMLSIIGGLFILVALACGIASADSTVPEAPGPAVAKQVTGFGPDIIATTSAFYLDGKYKILQGSPMVGAAYSWTDKGNVNSAGLYAGPAIVYSGGTTTTTVNVLAHLKLFQGSGYSIGGGIGTEFWTSGEGVNPTKAKTFISLDIGFGGVPVQ